MAVIEKDTLTDAKLNSLETDSFSLILISLTMVNIVPWVSCFYGDLLFFH